MALITGLKGIAVRMIQPEDTARAYGSGSLPVFATPGMIALMEQAACRAVENALEEGQTTVGIAAEITHDAATPVGMEVTAEATLVAIEGKKLTFSVTAKDFAGLIGSGTHRRCIVNAERFLNRANQKL